MLTSLEKSLPRIATNETVSRFSLREQLRKLGLGSMLLMSSYLTGCCLTGSNPTPSAPIISSEEIIRRSLTDAGPDADTGVPPPIGSVTAVPPGVDAGVPIPAYQGTPEFRAERELCFRALPAHACLYDNSTTDAAGHVTRTSHTLELSPAFAIENNHVGPDMWTTSDHFCELRTAAGVRRFIFVLQHDGSYYTYDFNNPAGVDLVYHRLVPGTRRSIASTVNPCPRL